jgi:hypothetical protein
MSVALGEDPKNAAIQLGKALNDPVKGMTALQRVGVSFTEDAEEAGRGDGEVGDTMGAQKLILHELNKEFGGSADAMGRTLPGQINILKARFDDLAQNIGQKLVPILTQAVTWVTAALAADQRRRGTVLQAVAAGGHELPDPGVRGHQERHRGRRRVGARALGADQRGDDEGDGHDPRDHRPHRHRDRHALEQVRRDADEVHGRDAPQRVAGGEGRLRRHRGALQARSRTCSTAGGARRGTTSSRSSAARSPSSRAILKQAVNTMATVAAMLGKAILDGIWHFIEKLPGKVKSGIGAAIKAVGALETLAFAEAVKIGKALGEGVIHGIEGMAGAVAGAAEGMSSTRQRAEERRGIIPRHEDEGGGRQAARRGRDRGDDPRPDPALREAERQLPRGDPSGAGGRPEARSEMSSAFGELVADANRAFDAETKQVLAKLETARKQLTSRRSAAAGMTPEEKKLADEQAAHDEAQRQQAIADAQGGARRRASLRGPQQILQAQRALDDALYQEQVAADQKAADQSRVAADAKAKASRVQRTRSSRRRRPTTRRPVRR